MEYKNLKDSELVSLAKERMETKNYNSRYWVFVKTILDRYNGYMFTEKKDMFSISFLN
jgi:hypothetical protein